MARAKNLVGALPILLLFAAPVVITAYFAQVAIWNENAWGQLFAHPQLWPSLALSLATGGAAAILSFLLANQIAQVLYFQGHLSKAQTYLGPMLAIPHLALAIALGFLVMPTGLFARLIAFCLHWQSPPSWITNHDPFGVFLVMALVLKETPFTLFIFVSHFLREDVALRLAQQSAVARSLGHKDNSLWWRIILPQTLSALAWPMAVVFIYAASVVDVALAIGPTEPPTLATVIWADINSADVLNNARGGAGVWLLTATMAAIILGTVVMWRVFKPAFRQFLTKGTSSDYRPPSAQEKISKGRRNFVWYLLIVTYLVMLVALALLSIARAWPFPNLLPITVDMAAWKTAFSAPQPLINSCLLALATSFSSLLILLAWFETRANDLVLRWLSLLTLALPSLVLGLGQYQTLLWFGLTGQWWGLYLVHLMPVLAYMFIVLSGPYRSFDQRWISTANALQQMPLKSQWFIKLPLLKPAIFGSVIIGFAVSFAQYVPAQLASAGRYTTLPIEAVTLTSGANRPLTATYALQLAALPLLIFLIAKRLSQPRWKPA